ncbi:hypothetical protein MJT46_015548 [Ovis ammon polii x Ovis aries]|nr:hypothetical protein MJT46_015548 [Ovis ammon polii x Ovis aries]
MLDIAGHHTVYIPVTAASFPGYRNLDTALTPELAEGTASKIQPGKPYIRPEAVLENDGAKTAELTGEAYRFEEVKGASEAAWNNVKESHSILQEFVSP